MKIKAHPEKETRKCSTKAIEVPKAGCEVKVTGAMSRLSVGITAGSPRSKQKMKSSPKLMNKLKIAKMDGVELV